MVLTTPEGAVKATDIASARTVASMVLENDFVVNTIADQLLQYNHMTMLTVIGWNPQEIQIVPVLTGTLCLHKILNNPTSIDKVNRKIHIFGTINKVYAFTVPV